MVVSLLSLEKDLSSCNILSQLSRWIYSRVVCFFLNNLLSVSKITFTFFSIYTMISIPYYVLTLARLLVMILKEENSIT